MLAGKLSINDPDYLQAVNILIEGGATINCKDRFGQKLGDISRQMNNVGLYSVIFHEKNEQRKQKWQSNRLAVLESLRDIPDCYFEVYWDLSCCYLPGI